MVEHGAQLLASSGPRELLVFYLCVQQSSWDGQILVPVLDCGVRVLGNR
jgi:hypothetical protein